MTACFGQQEYRCYRRSEPGLLGAAGYLVVVLRQQATER